MDTLLKTHTKLEFLRPLNGLSEKLTYCNSFRHEVRTGSLKKPGRTGRVAGAASSKALLEMVPETKKESLDFHLPLYDPSKNLVVGGRPAGLAVAQQVSQAGLSVCSIDPSPKLIWPNNYGVWVDEFEAMDLLDCLDTTWSAVVVYIDEESKKDLARPYGRVNRKQFKSKMLQKYIVVKSTISSLLIYNIYNTEIRVKTKRMLLSHHFLLIIYL